MANRITICRLISRCRGLLKRKHLFFMLLPVQPHILLGAGSALPMAVARMDVGIFWCELVSSFAVRLFRVKASAAIGVDLVGDRLDVHRIAAASSPAYVIQNETVRDGSDKEFVAEPMDVDVLTFKPDNAVTPSIPATCPEPATGIGFWINLLLNTRRQSE